MEMNLGENVKHLRKERGWSQAQLAEKISAHLTHINRIETGKYVPALDTVLKLANVLEVPIDFLVTNTNGNLKEVKIEDQTFSERIKMLNSLNVAEQEAVTMFIDALLSKKKMIGMLKELDAS